MKRVNKSALLWYSPREMYELVTDVQRYPEFLPWCERAEVLDSAPEGMTARLHLRFGTLRHAFTTRNEHVPQQSVSLRLVDGPFTALDGIWRFLSISREGVELQGCRIEFEMSYAFSSPAVQKVLSPLFDKAATSLVDRFVQRAERVYGPR